MIINNMWQIQLSVIPINGILKYNKGVCFSILCHKILLKMIEYVEFILF